MQSPAPSCSHSQCHCQEDALDDYLVMKKQTNRAFIKFVKWYNSEKTNSHSQLSLSPKQIENLHMLHGEWKGGFVRMKDYAKMHKVLDNVDEIAANIEWKVYKMLYDDMMVAFKASV